MSSLSFLSLPNSLHYKVMGKRGDQKSNRSLCFCDCVVIVPFPEGNETHRFTTTQRSTHC